MAKVLVAYGSKRGGTQGIAIILGESLRATGLTVDVRACDQVHDVSAYDAIVVGGSIYAGHWHRAARHFVKEYRNDLLERPVWLFSSGPLDDSADNGTLAPEKQVAGYVSRVDARGHMTFGGYLSETAKGVIAKRMSKSMAGDWRNKDQIKAWGKLIAQELAQIDLTRRDLSVH